MKHCLNEEEEDLMWFTIMNFRKAPANNCYLVAAKMLQIAIMRDEGQRQDGRTEKGDGVQMMLDQLARIETWQEHKQAENEDFR